MQLNATATLETLWLVAFSDDGPLQGLSATKAKETLFAKLITKSIAKLIATLIAKPI